MSSVQTAHALGCTIASVEQTLHRWERGDIQVQPGESDGYGHSKEQHSPSSSRRRVSSRFLEHLVGGEDGDEILLAPLLAKSPRPLLRDFSIDPSTLCKAACAFARCSNLNKYIEGGWSFTRVAMRLLSSRDGRLLRECSLNDIVRLCEAAVLCDMETSGREISGLFARKVLQVLNDSVDDDGKMKSGSTISLGVASASEVCSLLWSLGELGAKHSLDYETKPTAYKRMRLVCPLPALSEEELQSLRSFQVLNLVRLIPFHSFFESFLSFLALKVIWGTNLIMFVLFPSIDVFVLFSPMSNVKLHSFEGLFE